MKITAQVKGMHCASCAMTIEKSVKKLEGVKSISVNYGNEKATIDFDETKITPAKFNQTIGPFGYEIETTDQKKSSTISSSKKEKLDALNKLKTEVFIGLTFAGISTIQMFWMILADQNLIFEMPMSVKDILMTLLPIFATYTLFVIGRRYLKGIQNFIKFKVANMDTLVGIGTLTAYIYSMMIVLFSNQLADYIDVNHTYFDVVIIVIALISFGKYLEEKSKLSTGDAIEKLLNLQAKNALVLRDNEFVEVAVDQIVLGDVLLIKPGAKIPIDSVIIEGETYVDESMITGEPMPTHRTVGDEVIGGTINKNGSIKVKVIKVGSNTMLARIIQMVEDAQATKAPIQKLADKISAISVPIVLMISAVTLITWLTIGSLYLPFNEALRYGILCFIGVLVIACPCALGLATPTAIIVGTGKGARNGILIKDAESLQKLSQVNTIVFDKTGTITLGKPSVTAIKIYDKAVSESKLLEIAISLEHLSEHPLALSIVEKATQEDISPLKVTSFKNIEGRGVSGSINGEKYLIGSKTFMIESGLKIDESEFIATAEGGITPIYVSTEKRLLGTIGISDPIKDHSRASIELLKKEGLKIVMLTGDNKITAKSIAAQVGIEDVISDVLPDQKADKIRSLKKEGSVVAMVGDGINDAPALALADVGIAMGTGTDVAIESAQITLLRGDLEKVIKSIHLSKQTMRAVKQNLFWAFIYNLVGIPLAAGFFYPIFGILLNPIFAGAAMAFSSVSVVSNSLRFKYTKL